MSLCDCLHRRQSVTHTLGGDHKGVSLVKFNWTYARMIPMQRTDMDAEYSSREDLLSLCMVDIFNVKEIGLYMAFRNVS